MDKQTAKFIAAITQALPDVPSQIMQGWIEDPTALKEHLAFLAPPPLPVGYGNTTHLRFLQSVRLAPTTGSTTLAQAGDVFTVQLDPNFEKWGTNKFGVDTPQQSVAIFEMTKAGTFATLLNSFDVGDISSLCLSQGQIKELSHSHRDVLQQDGFATLFLFRVEGEVFVARVRVHGGGLAASVNRFSDGRVWGADFPHRVVVPQQTV